MMRSIDAFPSGTEGGLKAIQGRTADFCKTSVVCARRKQVPRLSFQTCVAYRGTSGKKVPLSDMGDSCLILWWIKKYTPYQIFASTPMSSCMSLRGCLHRRSSVAYWSGKTTDVAQCRLTLRDSSTSGLSSTGLLLRKFSLQPLLLRNLDKCPLKLMMMMMMMMTMMCNNHQLRNRPPIS